MLKSEPISNIPPDTQRIAHASFPKGTTITKLWDAFSTIYEDADFATLFSTRGQPTLAPWRLALITVFQFLENLTDRQAADAVRSRIEKEVRPFAGAERCRIRFQCAQRVPRSIARQ